MVRREMWPTGGRSWMAHCRARAWKCRRCRPARIRNAPRNLEPDGMSAKTVHNLGIIMNGATGRMGLNQHLRGSLDAIAKQGGVRISDSESIMPKPLLVGRNANKLEAISAEFGGLPWTTDLDKALANPDYRSEERRVGKEGRTRW